MKSEPVKVAQFSIEEDIPYMGTRSLSDKTPAVLKHMDQMKSSSSFLHEYGETYPRVATEVCTMIAELVCGGAWIFCHERS